jgi:purine nucleosidase
MSRKVLIDCDPGIADAVAVCLALFDPRLEVLAITATAGNVQAQQASRNVHAIIDQLDPPRFPRVGVATPPDRIPEVDGRAFNGEDGLGNSGLAFADLIHKHPAEKVICDVVRAAPEEVTIVALGPLTNIARAFTRDPELVTMVGRIIMSGGSVAGIGDVTAAAEYNIYCDPPSARAVFRSPTTKTLIPLDVTMQVVLTLDFLDELPDESTRAGAFLRRILPFSYRAYRQNLGREGIHLNDAVATLAAIDPELFMTQEMAGDVETTGELTIGATVFDRRHTPRWRANMEVATGVDVAAVKDGLLRCLRRAGQESGRASEM